MGPQPPGEHSYYTNRGLILLITDAVPAPQQEAVPSHPLPRGFRSLPDALLDTHGELSRQVQTALLALL